MLSLRALLLAAPVDARRVGRRCRCTGGPTQSRRDQTPRAGWGRCGPCRPACCSRQPLRSAQAARRVSGGGAPAAAPRPWGSPLRARAPPDSMGGPAASRSQCRAPPGRPRPQRCVAASRRTAPGDAARNDPRTTKQCPQRRKLSPVLVPGVKAPLSRRQATRAPACLRRQKSPVPVTLKSQGLLWLIMKMSMPIGSSSYSHHSRPSQPPLAPPPRCCALGGEPLLPDAPACCCCCCC